MVTRLGFLVYYLDQSTLISILEDAIRGPRSRQTTRPARSERDTTKLVTM